MTQPSDKAVDCARNVIYSDCGFTAANTFDIHKAAKRIDAHTQVAVREALEEERKATEPLVGAVYRWLYAHYVLQDGLNSFELGNSTVDEADKALADMESVLTAHRAKMKGKV